MIPGHIDPRLERDDVACVPILHGRMESALEVRRRFDSVKPGAVAVELPGTIKPAFIRAVTRLPLLSVVHYQQGDGQMVYLPVEPTDALAEAVRLGMEHGLPVHFIDRDTDDYPLHVDPYPDLYAAARIGYRRFCTLCAVAYDFSPDTEDDLRERTMAFRLTELKKQGEPILFVCGLVHYPRVMDLVDEPLALPIGRVKRPDVHVAHLDEISSREIMTEPGRFAAIYEEARKTPDLPEPDRLELQERLWAEAAARHKTEDQEELAAWQWSILRRFTRNYALVTGRLTPSVYQLIIGARAAAGDDFAYHVWDVATDYPWQEDEPELSTIRISGEDLFLDQKVIHFHKRLKSMRRQLMPVPVKKRPKERFPGEWDTDWSRADICSWPPEDVVLEDFGEHLKKRATGMLSAENRRTVPFTSSILDGVDVRETIRRFYEDKLYVFEDRPVRGKVGSVVVIFDPDLDDENFPWKLTWLGEHEQESDMAFYATPLGQLNVGPGVSRCLHGGFMLTYPPMRVYDIWSDPYFDVAKNKPERLLMAAIEYSEEKFIVHAAKNPPPPRMKHLAERMGKQVVHLPLGSFSPQMLSRMRAFHVLAGHNVRRYAKEFIR